MEKFKTRNNPEYGYRSIWHDLVTLRLSAREPLPPTQCEFYDVSLGRMCNMHCPYCYTNAYRYGRVYTHVVEKIKHLINTIWKDTNVRPYQVAIGSEGEPTIHPEFIEVLKVFAENGIVPNYTTNGKVFAELDKSPVPHLLEYTNKYCGGVALSANSNNKYWSSAFDLLNEYANVKLNIHLIASDKQSISYIKDVMEKTDGKAWTFVILPLVACGRSTKCMTDDTYEELANLINTYKGKTQIAVGARMYPWLTDPNRPKINGVQSHEPEMFSKNLILDDTIKITPSSFDTRTILWQTETHF